MAKFTARCRFVALVLFWVPSAFPPLLAQSPKELMTDACQNELQQRKQNALWVSQVQRLSAEHVYREQEIDTVEGTIRPLLSIDGHPPSPSEQKRDEDRLRQLQKTRLTLKKNQEAAEQKVDDLLRAIPDMFIYEDQGKQGSLERLAFAPNPAYKPTSYQEAALHALSGVVLIDLREKQVAQFSGTLTQQVEFAHGLLGHLDKGGMIEVNRVRLSPGLWETSSFRTDLDGRFAIFENMNKQIAETRSDFEPLLPDTNIQRALEQFDLSPHFSFSRQKEISSDPMNPKTHFEESCLFSLSSVLPQ